MANYAATLDIDLTIKCFMGPATAPTGFMATTTIEGVVDTDTLTFLDANGRTTYVGTVANMQPDGSCELSLAPE